MTRKVVRLLAACALVVTMRTGHMRAQDTAPSAAQASAETWLALLDARDYGASWETAASSFRKIVPRQTWLETVEDVRVQLGGLKSRVLRSATPEKPPKPLQGEYIVFRFTSTFDRGPELIEVIAALREGDGIWRVAGYLVK